MPELLTVQEVAAILQLSESEVRASASAATCPNTESAGAGDVSDSGEFDVEAYVEGARVRPAAAQAEAKRKIRTDRMSDGRPYRYFR